MSQPLMEAMHCLTRLLHATGAATLLCLSACGTPGLSTADSRPGPADAPASSGVATPYDAPATTPSPTAQAELLWLGQAAFRLTTPSGKVIMIDPWLRPNPKTPAAYKDLAHLGHVDLILVTHGHADHIADAPDLARMNHARVYAPGDLNQVLTVLGVLPPELAPRMNKSGTVTPFPDVPGLRITAVKAEHSSVYVWKNPASGKEEAYYGGEPMGFIIELENGQRIYHMGDTGLFSDLKFIADYYHPDVVLIPIGGNFTMGPTDAAYATRHWLHPKVAIPMHYGTNPLNQGTPQQYRDALGDTPTHVLVLQPGEAYRF